MSNQKKGIDNLVDIINGSNNIIGSIEKNEDTLSFKSKSKIIYKNFKQIIKTLSANKMQSQLDIMNQTINNISKLTDEYERIKLYQYGLYELGISLNSKKFIVDQNAINNLTQIGGTSSDDFNKITQRLTEKLNTMNRLSTQVNSMMDNIIGLIGDTTSSNGLINIRLKIEWILENFQKYLDDSETSKKMIGQIKGLLDTVDTNISSQSLNAEKLDKIKSDLRTFTSDMSGIISKTNSAQLSNVIGNNPIVQPINPLIGGNLSNDYNYQQNLLDNLQNLHNLQDQIGGRGEFDEYFKIETIDNWLIFFKNIKSWSDDNRIIFGRIRAYYYMIRKACKLIIERCSNSDYLKSLYGDFLNSIESVEYLMKMSADNLSDVLEAEFSQKNKESGAIELNARRIEAIPLDPNELLLNILINNYNTTASNTALSTDLNALKNAHTNLMELFNSLSFIDMLCKSLSYRNKMSEKVSAYLDQTYDNLISLTYRNQLLDTPENYNNFKTKLITEAYDSCFKKPLDKLLLFKDNLDQDTISLLSLYKQNYQNYILGMSYSNSYSQLLNVPEIPLITVFSLNQQTQDNYNNSLNNIIKIRNALQGSDQKSIIFNNIINISIDSDQIFDIKTNYRIIEELSNLYLESNDEQNFAKIKVLSESDLIDLNSLKSTGITKKPNRFVKTDIAEFFSKKEFFPELIDVKLDGDSMLHSVYFSTIEKGGKNYLPSDLTISAKYRENLTEGNYLTAAGSKDKFIQEIRQWITLYGQKLIDNKDKFSSAGLNSTTIDDYERIKLANSDDSDAIIKLYVAIMSTSLTDLLKKTYLTYDMMPYLLKSLDLKALAIGLKKNIVLNNNNIKITLYKKDGTINRIDDIMDTDTGFIYHNGAGHYNYYKFDQNKINDIKEKLKTIVPTTELYGGSNLVEQHFNLLSQEINRVNASKTRNIKTKLSDFIQGLTKESVDSIIAKKDTYRLQSEGIDYIGKVQQIEDKINKFLDINGLNTDLINNYYIRFSDYIGELTNTLKQQEAVTELNTIKYGLIAKKEELRLKISQSKNDIDSLLELIHSIKEDLSDVYKIYSKYLKTPPATDAEKIESSDATNAYTEALKSYKDSLQNIFEKTSAKNRLSYASLKVTDLIVLTETKLNEIKLENIKLTKQKMIINTLESVNSGGAKFDETQKKDLTEKLSLQLIPYDITSYVETSENNMALVTRFDKILTESINAIKVYVKARDEFGGIKSDKFNPLSTCLELNLSDLIQPAIYGKFEKIYWTNTNLADLYCGEGVSCTKKEPLTKGIRDTTMIGFKSNIYYTEGFSGSGKSTLLLGLGMGDTSSDKKNSVGIISRIIQDLLENITIPSNGTKINIEYMIGEIYGEKKSLSVLDSKFTECMYLWKLGDKIEEIQIANSGANSGANSIDSVLKDLENIEKSRSFYKDMDSKYNFKISEFDKAKYLNTIGKDGFNPTDINPPDEIKKFVNLANYTHTDSQQYKKKFNIGLKSSDSIQIYDLLSGNSKTANFYKSFTKQVINRQDIIDGSTDFTLELNSNIEKIQAIRREKNRVRCTKYNPDSSRSHMFFIFRVKNGIDYKYYTFIDKAGNEIPYNIAVDEFSRLAERVNLDELLFNIDDPANTISSTKQDETEARTELLTGLLNALIVPNNITNSQWVSKIDNIIRNPDNININFDIILSPSSKLEFNLKPNIIVEKETTSFTVGTGQSGSQQNFKIKNWTAEFKFKLLSDESKSIEYTFTKNSDDMAIYVGDICDQIRLKQISLFPNAVQEPLDIVIFHRELSKEIIRKRIGQMIMHESTEVSTESYFNTISDLTQSLDTKKIELTDSISTAQNKIFINTDTINLKNITLVDSTNPINDIKQISGSTGLEYNSITNIKNYDLPDTFQAITNNIDAYKIGAIAASISSGSGSGSSSGTGAGAKKNASSGSGGGGKKKSTSSSTSSSVAVGASTVSIMGGSISDTDAFYLINNANIKNSYINLFTTLEHIRTTSDFGTKLRNNAKALKDRLLIQYNKFNIGNANELSNSNIEISGMTIAKSGSVPAIAAPKDNKPALNNIEKLNIIKTTAKKSEKVSELLKKIKLSIDKLELSSLKYYLFELADSPLTKQLNILINKFNADKDLTILEFQAELNNSIGISGKDPSPIDSADPKVADVKKLYDLIKEKYKNNLSNLRSKLCIKMLETIIRNLSDYAVVSSIDETEPTTDDLSVDYTKLLSSYYIQRSYFSKIESNSSYGCNNPQIQSALNHLTETLAFMFDNKDSNALTRVFMEQNDSDSNLSGGVNEFLEIIKKSSETINKSSERLQKLSDIKTAFELIDLNNIWDYITIISSTYHSNNKTGSIIGSRNRSFLGNDDKDLRKDGSPAMYVGSDFTNLNASINTSDDIYMPMVQTAFSKHNLKIIDLCNKINTYYNIVEPTKQINLSAYNKAYADVITNNPIKNTSPASFRTNLKSLFDEYIKLFGYIDFVLGSISPGSIFNAGTIAISSDKLADATESSTMIPGHHLEYFNEIKTKILNKLKIDASRFTTFTNEQIALIKTNLETIYKVDSQSQSKYLALFDNIKTPLTLLDVEVLDAANNEINTTEIYKLVRLIHTDLKDNFLNKTKLCDLLSTNMIPNNRSFNLLTDRYLDLFKLNDLQFNPGADLANKDSLIVSNLLISDNLNQLYKHISNSMAQTLNINSDGKLDSLTVTDVPNRITNTIIKTSIENSKSEKITKYKQSAIRYQPINLFNLDTIFGNDLPIDFSIFKNPDINIKILKQSGTNQFLFFGSDEEVVDKAMRNFVNFLVRLKLISNLAHSFAFLDIESNINNLQTNPKFLISLFNDGSLVDNFNDILYADNDKITYVKEYEKQFNVKSMFIIQRLSTKTAFEIELLDQMIKEKMIWLNGSHLVWKTLADKLIPLYLLNVKQGFWINHSIRMLMRTLMYSTDNKYIDKDLFKADIMTAQTNYREKYTDKNIGPAIDTPPYKDAYANSKDTAIKLVQNIKLLSNDAKIIKTDENAANFISDIISQKQTLEEYQLSNFKIESSIWLKLLITIQHLGANINPIELKPSGSAIMPEYTLLNDENFSLSKDDYKTKSSDFNNELTTYKNQLNPTISISKSQILLLALSTRADKFEGVRKTIEFSDIITKISNASCRSASKVLSGGGTHLGINNSSNNIKKKNYQKTKYVLTKLNKL
jgi:hypothetical protein